MLDIIKRILVLILILFITFNADFFGQSKEYIVKAVMIEKFLKFVEWPKETKEIKKEYFIIAVVGENPFDNMLERVFKGKKINGKKIKIKYESVNGNFYDSDLIFLAKDTINKQSDIISKISGTNILTISDFGYDGDCMINFLIDEDKVKFTVNMNSCKKSGIYVSSLLLNLAEKVLK